MKNSASACCLPSSAASNGGPTASRCARLNPSVLLSGPMARRPKPDRRRALESIYALVIAPLMVPAVPLALMAELALAAEPQMPEDFRGTWCGSDNASLRGEFGLYSCSADDSEIEITATGVTAEVGNPAIPVSCVVRQVTKFDVCPWGMIYKNRERARALRSFQINP